jgi:YHS domain-containing protein
MKPPEGTYVIDPVCEQVVDASRAVHTRSYRGKRFAFCCSRCLRRFDSDPERYASARYRGPYH